MRNAICSVLGLCTTTSCGYPSPTDVWPMDVPPVSPPIQTRVLVLIAPSFEEYLAEGDTTVFQVRVMYGHAARKALFALVAQSFTSANMRWVADSEVRSLRLYPADTSVADLLLLPSFSGASVVPTKMEGSFCCDALGNETTDDPWYQVRATVALRFDARSLHTGATFTWETVGTSEHLGFTSWGRFTGRALHAALQGLSDTLAAHRAALELAPPPP